MTDIMSMIPADADPEAVKEAIKRRIVRNAIKRKAVKNAIKRRAVKKSIAKKASGCNKSVESPTKIPALRLVSARPLADELVVG